MVKRKDFKRFGQHVCRQLDTHGLTLWELAERVEASSGRFVTESFLRKRLSTRCPRWLVTAIKSALRDIEQQSIK